MTEIVMEHLTQRSLKPTTSSHVVSTVR